MSPYSVAVFLHVVGALGLFAALGLEWAGVRNLRGAVTTSQAREWMKLLRGLRLGGRTVVAGAAGHRLLRERRDRRRTTLDRPRNSGSVDDRGVGWLLTGRRLRSVGRVIPEHDGPMTLLLARQLADPVFTLAAWLRTALALGIVFIMSTKPDRAGACHGVGNRTRARIGGRTAARRRCPAYAGIHGRVNMNDLTHELASLRLDDAATAHTTRSVGGHRLVRVRGRRAPRSSGGAAASSPRRRSRRRLPRVERSGGASSATPLLTASGYVVARRKAVVSAKIQGRLAELRVEEGARVLEGEVIARLESQDYDAQVRRAQAQVQQAAGADRERARRDSTR